MPVKFTAKEGGAGVEALRDGSLSSPSRHRQKGNKKQRSRAADEFGLGGTVKYSAGETGIRRLNPA